MLANVFRASISQSRFLVTLTNVLFCFVLFLFFKARICMGIGIVTLHLLPFGWLPISVSLWKASGAKTPNGCFAAKLLAFLAVNGHYDLMATIKRCCNCLHPIVVIKTSEFNACHKTFWRYILHSNVTYRRVSCVLLLAVI